MTLPTDMQRGLALRSYLAASHLFPLIARPILRKRLKRGKEHPTRWTEKLGQSLAPRPKGPLVWLHAVGLGEVLSLRGLIARMAAEQPDLSFLVTSSTAASAKVFGKNAPPPAQSISFCHSTPRPIAASFLIISALTYAFGRSKTFGPAWLAIWRHAAFRNLWWPRG